jgi:hemerythrin-like domain-containing protein
MADDPSPVLRSLASLLGRDHERLRALFARLIDEFREGDRDELRRTWSEFEAGLLAHFAAEEHHLLPLFERAAPTDAAALRDDHALFRRTLDELGVGVDLHSVKLDVAQGFVDALSEHARREDSKLYQWAERGVDPVGREALARDLASDFSRERGPRAK